MTLAIDSADMATSISVSDEMADWLYERKGRGETYEDVIRQLIREARGEDALPGTDDDVGTATTGDVTVIARAAEGDGDDGDDGRDLARVTDDVVDAGVLPGSGEKLDRRREALHAAVEYLREQGTAEPADFKSDVYPDHTAGYTGGKDPANSWWKNCVYKGLRAVAEQSDAVEKADYSGEWRYVGGQGKGGDGDR